MVKLDDELKLLERQIARVRAEARHKFLAAGISN